MLIARFLTQGTVRFLSRINYPLLPQVSLIPWTIDAMGSLQPKVPRSNSEIHHNPPLSPIRRRLSNSEIHHDPFAIYFKPRISCLFDHLIRTRGPTIIHTLYSSSPQSSPFQLLCSNSGIHHNPYSSHFKPTVLTLPTTVFKLGDPPESILLTVQAHNISYSPL